MREETVGKVKRAELAKLSLVWPRLRLLLLLRSKLAVNEQTAQKGKNSVFGAWEVQAMTAKQHQQQQPQYSTTLTLKMLTLKMKMKCTTTCRCLQLSDSTGGGSGGNLRQACYCILILLLLLLLLKRARSATCLCVWTLSFYLPLKLSQRQERTTNHTEDGAQQKAEATVICPISGDYTDEKKRTQWPNVK